MKTILKFCFNTLLMLTALGAFSQNEGRQWFFGTNAGLDFNTVPPTPITIGMLTTSEGCSSISDANGNLLFYTDGITVYNQVHAVMANGNGLFGSGSSTQSGVIVKQPGSSTIYYVFTVDDVGGPNGLCYSTVDMSLAAGMGSVTAKNVFLYAPSTEKITGVRHCNGVDIWVVSHDYNSNNFRCYLVTSTGVNATPVITAVGTAHVGGSSLCVGALKTSPNGKKIGICVSNVLNIIELYDFDNTSGVVSNLVSLGNFTGVYGCEFSPDGTKFYGSVWGGTRLYQWDLCAGNSTAIVASQSTVSCSNTGQMQLAPDGKIYVARSGQSDLGVINNPNANGAANCNYVNVGQNLGIKKSTWGLPNFITSFLSAPFTYTVACSTASFNAPPAPSGTNSGCTASGNTITSISWNFGEPSSGSANTSVLNAPTHNYGGPGTYTVKLIRTSNCGTDTIQLPVVVPISAVTVSASPTVTQANCQSTVNAFNLGLSFIPANPAPSYTITWNNIPNGVTSNTQTSASGQIAPGQYIATIETGNGCFTSASFIIDPPTSALQFSILPHFELNCYQPTLNISVDPTNTYTWVSLFAGPFNGSSMNFGLTSGGTWTVTAENSFGCSGTETFVITQSTLAPSSSIFPLSQNITCSLSSITTVSGTASPSVNVSQVITSPQGGIYSSNSYTTLYVPGGTGTFTHCAVNNANGCSTCKTFTVTSNQGFPTFTVASSSNFTLGCNTKSISTISIVDGNTNPAGGPVSYALLAPGQSSITPPGSLTAISVYSVTVPGSYTVITKDNTSFCETRSPITILQNTFAPNITAAVAYDVLSCDNPTVLLQGSSLTQNVSYNWGFPPVSGPGNVPQASLTVSAFTAQPQQTLVANYTLTITDNNSTCQSFSVVPIKQNLFPPKALISGGGGTGLSCKTPTLYLTNSSESNIPDNTFNKELPVIGFIWKGPTPQIPGQFSSTYLAEIPGTYTMIAKDLNNGCITTATTIVNDDRRFPVVNSPIAAPNAYLDCGEESAQLKPIISQPSTGYTYSWTAFQTASVNGASTPTLFTNAIGDYKIVVTNTLNGCSGEAFMLVYSGSLTANFEASDSLGFAPLTVTFTNTSMSTLGNAGIVSAWGLGNGTATITTSASDVISTQYSAAGVYSVMLFVSKGQCLDTVIKRIYVESSSKLKVPNVFSPNGDGVNDLFFLEATNLSEISIIITDRWGNLVYQLSSKSGNIEWDGKNQSGIDASDGVYFYVLNAEGTDGARFEKQGNITLIR